MDGWMDIDHTFSFYHMMCCYLVIEYFLWWHKVDHALSTTTAQLKVDFLCFPDLKKYIKIKNEHSESLMAIFINSF